MRYVTKLRFMAGLAQRMNEMTGNAAQPPVQVMMGELAALVSIYEGMLLAHETAATIEDGVLWPSRTALYRRDGAAIGAQRPHAGNRPRAGRRRFHHAAVVGSRLRQSGNRKRHRALHALGHCRRQDARRADAARSGISSAPSSAAATPNTKNSTAAPRSPSKLNLYRNFDFKRAGALVDRALNLPGIE